MTATPPGSSIRGTITGNTGQAALGVNIRQQAIYLTVEISSGDPASLERLARAIRFDPIPPRITAWGRDFPNLIGRTGAVARAQGVLAGRGSVSVYGEEGFGKTVLLRHLARRGSDAFGGVVVLPTGGNRWQDIAQDVVKSFYRAEVSTYLSATELQKLLVGLDALVLLDDVDPGADIGALYTMCENASFVLVSTARLLAGDTDAVALDGLDAAAAAELIGATLMQAGVAPAVEPAIAARIGAALDGSPGQIIRTVEDAVRRHIELAVLADELSDPRQAAAADVARLGPSEHAIIDAVAALDGAPVGPEHVAAVVPGATRLTVDEFVGRKFLRAASPQVRLAPELVATVRQTDVDADAIRARYLERFIDWAGSGKSSPGDVADESRAILYVLAWARRAGQHAAVAKLGACVEGAFALAGRWGAWEAVTGYRLRAAEALGENADAAIALNQMGIQALGRDAPDRARKAFEEALDRARAARAPAVARVAEQNLRLIDGLLAPPHAGKSDVGTPGPPASRPRRGRHPVLAGNGHHFPWRWAIVGVGAVVVITAIALLLLFNRVALAIDPPARDLAAATVQADGEEATFTVRNTGTATLEALTVTLTGDGADEFFIVGGDCRAATLRAGQACTVTVLFHPKRSGVASAILTVTPTGGTGVAASIRSQAADATPAPTPTPTIEPSAPASVEPNGQADLAIRAFFPTDVPRLGDFVEIPVEVVIVNAGTADAGVFRVVITADDQPVPFAVEGNDQLDVMTRAPLGPDAAVTLDGLVQLRRDTPLDAVKLVVHVDSCLREPSAREACDVVESNEPNNSYRLQSVDLQISNLALETPHEPSGVYAFAPPLDVPISFDLRSTGPEDASEFWIGAFSGQTAASLELKGFELAPTSGLVRVPGLAAGETIRMEGIAHVARDSIDVELTVVVGCPPGAQPCRVPEIAYENDYVSQSIPQPTPAPVGAILTARGE